MKIAIIRVSALGDIIVSASFLHAFKEAIISKLGSEEKCEIEWFVDERFSGVLEDSPSITKLHILPFKKLFKSLGGILAIRRYCKNCGSFDYVIDAQGLIKSSLIGKFLNKKHFIGFDKDSIREALASLFYNKKVHVPYQENVLVRSKAIFFNPFNIDIDMNKALKRRQDSFGFDETRAKVALKDFSLDDKKEFKVLFILETSKDLKTYPVQSFLNLAKLLSSLANIRIFLIWYDDEIKAKKLSKDLKEAKVNSSLLPKLDLNAIKYLVSKMECVIGGDTGVTHLAWALNRPSITLFGNVESGLGGNNLSKTPLSRFLLSGEKNLYVCNKSKVFDVESITPNEVFETFKQIYLT
ncbi:lipopolysaccharide heptosyltransferase I [Helicobacter sp. 11S02629-2]|uniref:lipopolysaccharide heptosyltransferase I n=1 Tax=Helicobacter sp. 11S02629-2 TaxID=1476195 RepID=UPI000BA5D369|nr:lipopolysaccharide heptosyltransferase I [Helicobacter sp. 11S02629-2]PAF46053.1 lipopolysaccharide heptosyltransferase I [Helicobacter sp. 11S02629-2]